MFIVSDGIQKFGGHRTKCTAEQGKCTEMQTLPPEWVMISLSEFIYETEKGSL